MGQFDGKVAFLTGAGGIAAFIETAVTDGDSVSKAAR